MVNNPMTELESRFRYVNKNNNDIEDYKQAEKNYMEYAKNELVEDGKLAFEHEVGLYVTGTFEIKVEASNSEYFTMTKRTLKIYNLEIKELTVNSCSDTISISIRGVE